MRGALKLLLCACFATGSPVVVRAQHGDLGSVGASTARSLIPSPAREASAELPPISIPAEPGDEPAVPARRQIDGKPSYAPPQPCDRYWYVSSRCCKNIPDGTCGLHVAEVIGERPQPSSLPQMLAALSPGVPVCIMIHGSFVDEGLAWEDSLRTFRWLRHARGGGPLEIICYSWPSDQLGQIVVPILVNRMGRAAAEQGFYVADLIGRIPSCHPVTLLGHSHGARASVATLHLMGGGSIDGRFFVGADASGHRIRAILAGAAVDHHWLNPDEKYDQAPYRAEMMLNLVNRRDVVMALYPLRSICSRRPLARTGVTWLDRRQMGPISERVIDVDVTRYVRLGHAWENFTSEPELAATLAPFLLFQD